LKAQYYTTVPKCKYIALGIVLLALVVVIWQFYLSLTTKPVLYSSRERQFYADHISQRGTKSFLHGLQSLNVYSVVTGNSKVLHNALELEKCFDAHEAEAKETDSPLTTCLSTLECIQSASSHYHLIFKNNATQPYRHVIHATYVAGDVSYSVLPKEVKSMSQWKQYHFNEYHNRGYKNITSIEHKSHCGRKQFSLDTMQQSDAATAGQYIKQSMKMSRFQTITVYYTTKLGDTERWVVSGPEAVCIQHYDDIFNNKIAC